MYCKQQTELAICTTTALLLACTFSLSTCWSAGESGPIARQSQVKQTDFMQACPDCGSGVAPGTALCPHCGKQRCCPVCNPADYICCPTTMKETVEQDCYVVKTEPICIPPITWPWECCCKGKCGRVRCINVLEEESHECEECVTEWNVRRVQRCNCPACRRKSGHKAKQLFSPGKPLAEAGDSQKTEQIAAEEPTEATQPARQSNATFWSKIMPWQR